MKTLSETTKLACIPSRSEWENLVYYNILQHFKMVA